MSAALLTPCPCPGKHSLMEQMQQADAAAAVSSLSLSSDDSDGGKVAASAADASTAGARAGDASESETKWVEMPDEHVHWILAQKPEMHPIPSIEDYELYLYGTHDPAVKSTLASRTTNIDATWELFAALFVSLRGSHDDFFEYQAWVREVFERNGRVMVPEEAFGPRNDLQDGHGVGRSMPAREHPQSESDDSDQEEDEKEHACA